MTDKTLPDPRDFLRRVEVLITILRRRIEMHRTFNWLPSAEYKAEMAQVEQELSASRRETAKVGQMLARKLPGMNSMPTLRLIQKVECENDTEALVAALHAEQPLIEAACKCPKNMAEAAAASLIAAHPAGAEAAELEPLIREELGLSAKHVERDGGAPAMTTDPQGRTGMSSEAKRDISARIGALLICDWPLKSLEQLAFTQAVHDHVRRLIREGGVSFPSGERCELAEHDVLEKAIRLAARASPVDETAAWLDALASPDVQRDARDRMIAMDHPLLAALGILRVSPYRFFMTTLGIPELGMFKTTLDLVREAKEALWIESRPESEDVELENGRNPVILLLSYCDYLEACLGLPTLPPAERFKAFHELTKQFDTKLLRDAKFASEIRHGLTFTNWLRKRPCDGILVPDFPEGLHEPGDGEGSPSGTENQPGQASALPSSEAEKERRNMAERKQRYFLAAAGSIFYEVDSMQVAEHLLELLGRDKPEADKPFSIVDGATLDMPQRIISRQEIKSLEEFDDPSIEWDPGICADAGLPPPPTLDARSELLLRYRHQAQEWEPLVREELGLAAKDASGAQTTAKEERTASPKLDAALLSEGVRCAYALKDIYEIQYFYPNVMSMDEAQKMIAVLRASFERVLQSPGFEEFRALYDKWEEEKPETPANFGVFGSALLLGHPDVVVGKDGTVGNLREALNKCTATASGEVKRIIDRIFEVELHDCRLPAPADDSSYQEPRRYLQMLRACWEPCRSLILTARDYPIGWQPHPLLSLMLNLRERMRLCFKGLQESPERQVASQAMEGLIEICASGSPDAQSDIPEWTNDEVHKVEVFIEETRLKLGSASSPLTNAERNFLEYAHAQVQDYHKRVQEEWEKAHKRVKKIAAAQDAHDKRPESATGTAATPAAAPSPSTPGSAPLPASEKDAAKPVGGMKPSQPPIEVFVLAEIGLIPREGKVDMNGLLKLIGGSGARTIYSANQGKAGGRWAGWIGPDVQGLYDLKVNIGVTAFREKLSRQIRQRIRLHVESETPGKGRTRITVVQKLKQQGYTDGQIAALVDFYKAQPAGRAARVVQHGAEDLAETEDAEKTESE